MKMYVCRLCLTKAEKDEMRLIWNSNCEDLVNKIQECVSVQLVQNDKLPSTVCSACVEILNNWALFKEKCVKSNNYLLSTIVEDHKDNANACINQDYNNIFSTEDSESTLNNNAYECEICHRAFDTCFDYLNHQESHNGENVFKCSKCCEIFSNRSQLVLHERNHKSPCPQCGKQVLRSSLKLHLIKHSDKHKCIQCSNTFNSKASLSQHVITVHTNRKDHVCETCGKRFSSHSSMRVHSKSHSEDRSYPCKLCNYAGRTASALYIHMSTHANETCVCEVCSKTFKSARNLNDHLRRVHTKEKKHECIYCKKKFVHKYMLSVHLRSHTGVRPYQCPLCEKAFLRSDGLKEHMETHGQRSVYDCKACGKKYTSKRGVNRHHCNMAL